MSRSMWVIIGVGLCIASIVSGCSQNFSSVDDMGIPMAPLLTVSMLDEVYGEDSPQAEAEPIEIPVASLSTGEALGAREVYQLASDAIVFVETPRGSGSAVLIEPGYLVTNAHVVWPYDRARVVYPNGTEAEGMRVLAWDLIADLAILAPPKTNVTPLQLTDGGSLAVGSDVYLLGYPGEVDLYPQPAMTQGLLSRIRKWDPIDLSIFQVDADIGGGQSGGALLTDRGEFIGISTFYFTEARYALALSARDIAPRLEALLNETGTAFNDRRPLAAAGATEVTGELEDNGSIHLYFLNAEPGAKVRLQITGVGNPYFTITNGWGQLVATSQAVADKTHAAAFTIGESPPYLLWIEEDSLYRNTYTLTGTEPVIAYLDPDDGKKLSVGDTLVANLDAPGEFDTYELELRAGQKIALSADSLVFDPYVVISRVSDGSQELVFDDDGGSAGVFGNGAYLVYEAQKDETFDILVGDAMGDGRGGYFLSISDAPLEAKATKASQSREFYRTRLGLTELYESELYDFAMMIPASWSAQECPPDATACFVGTESNLIIGEDQIGFLPIRQRNSVSYMDQMEQLVLSGLPDGQLIDRKSLITQQGKIGEVVHMTEYGGLVQVSIFVYVDDKNNVAFTAALAAPVSKYADEPDFSMAENMFVTFRTWGADRPEEQAVFHLEKGMRLAAQGAYEDAILALDEAIKLDDTLLDAYRARVGIYIAMGKYDRALDDVAIMLDLEPDDYTIVSNQAWICWHKGDYSDAVSASIKAKELKPDHLPLINNHALYAAATGDYETALSELEHYSNVVGGELPPHVLDTRAYIFFSEGEYARALVDYEAALDKDFKRPVTLLGAGLTHVRLGDLDQALPMLEYAMELLDREEIEPVEYSPQLTELATRAAEILDPIFKPKIPG